MLTFGKRILFVGFGAVARCTIPILLKHIKVDPRSITVLELISRLVYRSASATGASIQQ